MLIGKNESGELLARFIECLVELLDIQWPVEVVSKILKKIIRKSSIHCTMEKASDPTAVGRLFYSLVYLVILLTSFFAYV